MRRRVTIINRNIPYQKNEGRRSHAGVIAYCDHCGFAIYSPEEAIIIGATDDIIHTDCWEEYSVEHMLDFAVRMSDKDDRSDT